MSVPFLPAPLLGEFEAKRKSSSWLMVPDPLVKLGLVTNDPEPGPPPPSNAEEDCQLDRELYVAWFDPYR